MTAHRIDRRRRRVGLASVALAAGLFAATAAEACVYVNGQWMSPADLQVVQAEYGVRVDCGSYWFDQASGYWGRMYGLMMGPPEGRLVAGGGGYGGGNGGGYGGGYGGAIDRGPGGTWGSDGQCSYFSTDSGDVMTGCD